MQTCLARSLPMLWLQNASQVEVWRLLVKPSPLETEWVPHRQIGDALSIPKSVLVQGVAQKRNRRVVRWGGPVGLKMEGPTNSDFLWGEDEADWSCATCQCPAAPLDTLEFNEQGCGFEPLDVVVQRKGTLDQVKSFVCAFQRRPPSPRKLPDGMDGSMANELLERASRTPRNYRCIAVLANFLFFFSIVSFISEVAT